MQFRDTTHYSAACKVAYVLLAGRKLSNYSQILGRKVITVDNNEKQVDFHAWKVKQGEWDVPEIECIRTVVNIIPNDHDYVANGELVPATEPSFSQATPTLIPTDRGSGESELSCSETLSQILQKNWGFSSLKDEQEKGIQAVLEKKDCFVTLPTGGGKSLIYQLAAHKSNGLTVVITSLKSLMCDQVLQCTKHGLIAAGLHGELQDSEKQGLYYSLKQTSCPIKVLLVTAEMISDNKVLQDILITLYSRKKLSLLVIDECHCVSKWGHQFRDSYLGLGRLRILFPSVPMLLLTATATKSTRDDVIKILKLDKPVVISAPMNRKNITYIVKEKTSNTADEIFALTQGVECSLVFCNTRKECEELSPKLQAKGLKCKFYHGGLSDNLRRQTQTEWINGSLQCLVCTNAFGMGINKENVRVVVHFSIPASLEDFSQESGRVGRDGLPATSVLYYSHQNQIFHVNNIYDKMKVDPGLCENQINCCNRMVYYAIQKGECRRAVILRYFDESADCNGMCDVCQKPSSTRERDITEFAKKAIQCVQRLTGSNGKFTLLYFAKVLTGKKVKHNHDQLPEYGCAKVSTTEGVYMLQTLAVCNILREIPPEKSTKIRNALYLTLGPSFFDVLSGSTTVSCKL